MGRAGFNEIIPAVLWQRGQFLTWPADQKRRALKDRGIRVVVNLWHKVDPDLSSDEHGTLYINWHISPSQPVPEFQRAHMINLLTTLMDDGMGVLVHCEAGRGRSVWLSTELVAHYSRMSYWDAYRFVSAKVAGASVRPEMRHHWGALEMAS